METVNNNFEGSLECFAVPPTSAYESSVINSIARQVVETSIYQFSTQDYAGAIRGAEQILKMNPTDLQIRQKLNVIIEAAKALSNSKI